MNPENPSRTPARPTAEARVAAGIAEAEHLLARLRTSATYADGASSAMNFRADIAAVRAILHALDPRHPDAQAHDPEWLAMTRS